MGLSTAYGQCGDTTHTTTPDDIWTSCQASTNPNATRGNSHWIMYDLGHVYTLKGSYIWNANGTGDTDQGFRQVSIDYSLDGSSWQELGSFEFEEASGYNSYTGFEGPDFDDVAARYVLLTAESNWGDPLCYGLSEVRFNLANVTSADFADQQSLISAYPNPATDFLNVEMGDVQPQLIRIVDIQGRVMQQHEGTTVPSRLNVSELPAGIYFLSVMDRQQRYHSVGFIKE